jgi:P-type E1-E2 ATPase
MYPFTTGTIDAYSPKYTNTRTCSIGDGGNDVGMIQEAHLGVGIVGIVFIQMQYRKNLK